MDKKINGCSLKKRTLKKWIYEHGYTQPIVAKMLKMDISDFKQRLRHRKPFSEIQIRRLVYFMGARSAFEVIYFTTLQERERVRRETFWEQRQKEQGKHGKAKISE